MAALLTTLSVLALSGPAVAVRDADFDLQSDFHLQSDSHPQNDLDGHGGWEGLGEQSGFLEERVHQVTAKAALARRANSSANASVGAHASVLDSALSSKGASETATCACIKQKANWKNYLQHLATRRCSQFCNFECHGRIFNQISPAQATKGGWADKDKPPKSGVVAASCPKEEQCECLDPSKNLETYKSKNYASTEECHQECKCTKETGYQGFCVGRWSWVWFLSQDQDCLASGSVGVVASCTLNQQFDLKEDSWGSGAYEGKLAQIDGAVKEKLSANVLDIQIYGCMYTSKVKLGYPNAKASWSATCSVTSSKWVWTVKDPNGDVRFSIEQKEVGGAKETSWQVWLGTGVERRSSYVVSTDDTTRDSDGYKLVVNKDTQVAGTLEHKIFTEGAEHETKSFHVTVQAKEDAGLILMASALIDKAFIAGLR